MQVDPTSFIWKEQDSSLPVLNILLFVAVKVHQAWCFVFYYERATSSGETLFSYVLGFTVDQFGLLGGKYLRVAAHIIQLVELKMRISRQYKEVASAYIKVKEAFLAAGLKKYKEPEGALWKPFSVYLLDPSEERQLIRAYSYLSSYLLESKEALTLFALELFTFVNVTALFMKLAKMNPLDNCLAVPSLIDNTSEILDNFKDAGPVFEKWTGKDLKTLYSALERYKASAQATNWAVSTTLKTLKFLSWVTDLHSPYPNNPSTGYTPPQLPGQNRWKQIKLGNSF